MTTKSSTLSSSNTKSKDTLTRCSACRKWREINSTAQGWSESTNKKWTCEMENYTCDVPEVETPSTRKNGKQNSTESSLMKNQIEKNDIKNQNQSPQYTLQKSQISKAARRGTKSKNDSNYVSPVAKSRRSLLSSAEFSDKPNTKSRRRSGRRRSGSDPGSPLLSLSYNYPGGKEWDSLRNCWVPKGKVSNDGAESPNEENKCDNTSLPEKGDETKSLHAEKPPAAEARTLHSKLPIHESAPVPQTFSHIETKSFQVEKPPAAEARKLPSHMSPEKYDEKTSLQTEKPPAAEASIPTSKLLISQEGAPPAPQTFFVDPADVNVNDFCHICKFDGNLMECYAEHGGKDIGCGNSVHIHCIGREKIPSGDWLCSGCATKQDLSLPKDKDSNYGYEFDESKDLNYGYACAPPGAWTRVSLGTRIAVYWPDDDQYYKARVMSRDGGSTVDLLYDDGVREKLDLRKEQIKILRHAPTSSSGTKRIPSLKLDSENNNDNEDVVRTKAKPKTKEEEAQIAALGCGDIVCGRGVSQATWAHGYAYDEFRKVIEAHSADYKGISSSNHTRRHTSEKVLELLNDEQLRFVIWNGDDWEPLSHDRSISKISHSFRDYRGPTEIVNHNNAEDDVRRNDIPLGRGRSKELRHRPVYRFFCDLIDTMIPEYDKAEKKQTVCLEVFIQLAQDRIRFVDICPRKKRWEEVSKDRSLGKIMKTFQDRRLRLVGASTTFRQLPSTGGRQHPLLVEDTSYKRRRRDIDPSFLVDPSNVHNSDIDNSSDGSIDSDSDEVSDDSDSVYNGAFNNLHIGPALLDLCSKIRTNKKLEERRRIPEAFYPAPETNPYSYFYQPPPAKKLKVSTQFDMIFDIIYASCPSKHGATQAASLYALPPPPRPPPQPQQKKLPPKKSTRKNAPPRPIVSEAPTIRHTSTFPPPIQREYSPNSPVPAPVQQVQPLPEEVSALALQDTTKEPESLYLGPPKPPLPQLSAHATAVLGSAALENPQRFRNYQVEVWTTRLNEAREFRRINGHCIIPHDFPENPLLARWAKRQRYQYQLYKNSSGKHYMTGERIRVLEALGFCWEHKSSIWAQRYNELRVFIKEHGHTLVPTGYPPNKKLATWVKCQRRQMKLREKGKSHCMTDERIRLLNLVHFAWQVNSSSGDSSPLFRKRDTSIGMPPMRATKKPPPTPAATALPDWKDCMIDSDIGEEERKIREKYKTKIQPSYYH